VHERVLHVNCATKLNFYHPKCKSRSVQTLFLVSQIFSVLSKQGKTLHFVYDAPQQVLEDSQRTGGSTRTGGKSRAVGLGGGLGRGTPRTAGTKTAAAKPSANTSKHIIHPSMFFPLQQGWTLGSVGVQVSLSMFVRQPSNYETYSINLATMNA